MTHDTIERLIQPILDYLRAVQEENYRLQTIKATIRVNAMRHGATDEEIEDMIEGRTLFIDWIQDVLKGDGK